MRVGAALCVGGKRTPLQLLIPGTANLKAQYLARANVTAFSQLFGSGAAPPAVSITATSYSNHVNPCDVQITKQGVLGVAEFRVSTDGINWVENQVTAVAYVIGTTGETLGFAAGSYTTEHRYTRTIDQEISQVGSISTTLGASGGVAATPLFQPFGLNGFPRAFNDGNAQRLQIIDATIGQLPSGLNKPFTVVLVCSLATISTTAPGALPLFGWGRSAVSANPFYHFSIRGPAGAPANAHASTRENDAGVPAAINDATQPPNLEPHVYVIRSTGTALTVTRDNVVVLSAAQTAGTSTLDLFTLGGLQRFGTAFAGSNVTVSECLVYNSDIGSGAATRLTNMYRMRYALGNEAQVRRLICLAWLGQSNANGIIGTLMPAPPPGLPFTQIHYLRRVLAGVEAVSDTALQQLKFTTVAGGTYHGPGLQAAIDLRNAGFTVFLLNCSANGSYLTDWIGAGVFSAALNTAFSDANTLLAALYPNAAREWYCAWDQGEAEAKDASAVPATNWPANFGSAPGPAAGTLLKKLNDDTGQTIRPRIMLTQSQLDTAPSSAPQLATQRASEATAATNSDGFLIDCDSLAVQAGYLMADNTHFTGRAQNFRGSLVAQSLLANELSGGP